MAAAGLGIGVFKGPSVGICHSSSWLSAPADVGVALLAGVVPEATDLNESADFRDAALEGSPGVEVPLTLTFCSTKPFSCSTLSSCVTPGAVTSAIVSVFVSVAGEISPRMAPLPLYCQSTICSEIEL